MTRTRLGRLNPVARLAAVVPVAAVLVLTLDVVSAGVALIVELALVPLAGLSFRRFWRITAVVWIAAPLGAITILLYGRPSGATWFQAGFVQISEGSAVLALATLLRVLAMALPSIVLFAGVDPTDLADGLAQLLRLPSRFVLGALAGVRTVSLFADDWRAIRLARRARGLGDRRGPAGFVGRAFALLVLALRRGGALSTAMEARGFPAPGRRTWARASRFGAREWGLVALGAVVAAVALASALVAGTWRFIGA